MNKYDIFAILLFGILINSWLFSSQIKEKAIQFSRLGAVPQEVIDYAKNEQLNWKNQKGKFQRLEWRKYSPNLEYLVEEWEASDKLGYKITIRQPITVTTATGTYKSFEYQAYEFSYPK